MFRPPILFTSEKIIMKYILIIILSLGSTGCIACKSFVRSYSTDEKQHEPSAGGAVVKTFTLLFPIVGWVFMPPKIIFDWIVEWDKEVNEERQEELMRLANMGPILLAAVTAGCNYGPEHLPALQQTRDTLNGAGNYQAARVYEEIIKEVEVTRDRQKEIDELKSQVVAFDRLMKERDSLFVKNNELAQRFNTGAWAKNSELAGKNAELTKNINIWIKNDEDQKKVLKELERTNTELITKNKELQQKNENWVTACNQVDLLKKEVEGLRGKLQPILQPVVPSLTPDQQKRLQEMQLKYTKVKEEITRLQAHKLGQEEGLKVTKNKVNEYCRTNNIPLGTPINELTNPVIQVLVRAVDEYRNSITEIEKKIPQLEDELPQLEARALSVQYGLGYTDNSRATGTVEEALR